MHQAIGEAMRFFLAHAKSDETDRLADLVKQARSAIDLVARGKPYELTLGRTYFDQRFKACGSWDAWCAEVATGVDFATREPIFNAILVPFGPVGAGTAKIITCALSAGKLAFMFHGDKLARIKGIEKVSDDWKAGWKLITESNFTP